MTELPMLAMGKSLGEYVRNHIVGKVRYNQIAHIVVLALDVLGKGTKLERIMAVQLPHGSSVALSWGLPNLSNKERNCARCCPVFASVIYLLSVENC